MTAASRALLATVAGLLALPGCQPVGPDFRAPAVATNSAWQQPLGDVFSSESVSLAAWWRLFDDEVLNRLVDRTRAGNNTIEIAALRVVEARATLAVVSGSRFPQAQALGGGARYVAPAADSLVARNRWQYDLGASLAWELDFWGRFRRSIEAADAAFLASMAAHSEAQVLLTATAVDLYSRLRVAEEQLRIARENVIIQERSYAIARINFEQGADSELDVQQAQTQLLSTRAGIPALEAALVQARNALSALTGQPPGAVDDLLAPAGDIPAVPETLSIGVPADLLRRRPDVRRAERLAAAQSARVGVAEAARYPSFSLTGSVGVSAGGLGDTSFGDLFDLDALNASAGASFLWPFLNYGRLENAVRVEDARLQQALINYLETALVAAREVEDAIAALVAARERAALLEETVAAARRALELSLLRYSEGYASFERVLRSQQALFSQQQRLVASQGDIALGVVALFRALGGGWDGTSAMPDLDAQTRDAMRARTDWGELIE